MTNGNYAVTNSKNLPADAVRELLSVLKSWHSLLKEHCNGNGNAAFQLEQNETFLQHMSSQQLHSNSKPRSPYYYDYVRVVPALSMDKLKHRQDVLSKVPKEATSGLTN